MVTVVPTASDVGVKLMILGVTGVVIRPIELPVTLVNQGPSEPAAIPSGAFPKHPKPCCSGNKVARWGGRVCR